MTFIDFVHEKHERHERHERHEKVCRYADLPGFKNLEGLAGNVQNRWNVSFESPLVPELQLGNVV